MIQFIQSTGLVAVLALALGCGKGGDTPQGDAGGKDRTTAALTEARKALLDTEPSGAKGVIETRKAAKAGEKVVLVGRIAGSEKPFVEGRAAFLVADMSIEPCPKEENCPTPWDCCCTPKEDLRDGTVQIKLVGSDGKTLNAGAKEALGVKELSEVVVTGTVNRDDTGSFSVIASGIFPRKGKE